MTNKAILSIHAVIYAIFALALFFLPDTMWPLYGLQVNDSYARFLSQHNSIFLGGLAVIFWLLRDIEDNNPVTGRLLLGLFWTNLLGVLITLYACLTGAFSGFGWSDPAFFSLLTIVCAFQISKNTKMENT